MGIKNTNRSILLLIILFFYSCKGQKEEKNSISVIQNIKANNSYFQLQKAIKNDETVFQYRDLKFELKSKEGESNLLINNEEFFIKLTLDSPDFNIWYYKNNIDKIILLEGNDYYSSVFYAYHLTNNKLFYLGNFTIDQPNVENEKPYKKEFKINIDKDKVIIQTLLNGSPSIKKTFNDQINQVQKENTDILISSIYKRNVQWSNHCENASEKDNIMLYSPDEISFNITSINFICGATSKQINNNTIEIYLKDSGTDYAPNGEVYSNNNVPKGINFDDCSLDIPIARVKIISEDSIEFQWLGFYNRKTNKREYIKNPFDNNKNIVVLAPCSEN
ncbi:hypothetical protein BBI01_03155 [Chryseobacterium artocarpi]|uniref:Uncharacterized protein n=1 Tax=Chryseobacterium artocarpi TaxID=1414727 RepID=A0A1B9A0U5_9FLAO|nr:hypothetical protein [Chryseobacterium artocarpi]OCA77465.1 hypothetical protein BBI01_03155 [Chryseobacterium artocarpi]